LESPFLLHFIDKLKPIRLFLRIVRNKKMGIFMKKIIYSYISILLFAGAANNIDARRRIPSPQTTQIKRNIRNNSKQLEAELKKAALAKTVVEKEQAKQQAQATIQALLENLEAERSLISDIVTGYSEQQILTARKKLQVLYPIQKDLQNVIGQLKNKLASITDKGWIWNSAIEGKEEAYQQLNTRLDKLNTKLTQVDRAIRNQKVIAGEEWSNAFRLLLLSGAVLGADYLATGGAGVGMIGSTFKTAGTKGLAALQSGREYASGKLGQVGTWLKERSGVGFDYAAIAFKHGTSAASMLLFLYNQYNQANDMYNMTKNIYTQLSQDEQSTPEDIERAQHTMLAAEKRVNERKAKLDQFRKDMDAGKYTPEQIQALKQMKQEQ
jgi:hypothetical protein